MILMVNDSNPLLTSPRLSPKQVIYEDARQNIYRVFADFGEFTKEYTVRDSGQRAGLVVASSDAVLLVQQYRFLINDLSWEIPGGKIDEGETPEAAAARECAEETGFQCQGLAPLVNFNPGLDTNHNPTHVFYSKDFNPITGFQIDPREVLHLEWIPLDRCVTMIFDNQIIDGLTIIALLAYDKLCSQGAVNA